MSDLLIRRARPDDARGIQEVLYEGWLVTYPNKTAGISTEDIHAFFGDAFSAQKMAAWRADIEDDQPNRLLLVGEENGKIVGFSRAFLRQGHNLLQAIYVRPGYQGKGIGRRMLASMDDFFDPTLDIMVQVAEYNDDAIAFYKKMGFVDSGKRIRNERFRMPISGNVIPELEMVKRKKTG